MNDELRSNSIQVTIEARIVAVVLGEAADFEREEIERLIDGRPDLAAFRDQVRSVDGLLKYVDSGESIGVDEDLKLPKESRGKVLNAINGQIEIEDGANEMVQRSQNLQAKEETFWTFRKVVALASLASGIGLFIFMAPKVEMARVASMPRSVQAEKGSDSFSVDVAAGAGMTAPMDGSEFADQEEAFERAFEPTSDLDQKQSSKSELSEIWKSQEGGGSLPSPYYLQDDVMYIPSGPDLAGSTRSKTAGTKRAIGAQSDRALMEPMESAMAAQSEDRSRLSERSDSRSGQQKAQVSGTLPNEAMAKSGEANVQLRGETSLPYLGMKGASSSVGKEMDRDESKSGRMTGAVDPFGMIEPQEEAQPGVSGKVQDLFDSIPLPKPTPTPKQSGGRGRSKKTKDKARQNSPFSELKTIPDSSISPSDDPFADETQLHELDGLKETPSLKQNIQYWRSLDRSGGSLRSEVGNTFGDSRSSTFSYEGRRPSEVDKEGVFAEQRSSDKPLASRRRPALLPRSNERANAPKNARPMRIVPKNIEKKKLRRESIAKNRPSPAGMNEVATDQQAFSTFSLHVSDVSFKLALSALSRGRWPDASKIRIEEFVNAFDYGDAMPCQSERIACRVEQCIHPFLQQRNLMRVSMRTAAAGRASSTPLRLTLLLDNSGSMERMDRQQTVREAFRLLAEQLTPKDQVTLISFARQPRLLADQVSGSQTKKLVQIVDELPSEGGTNLESALTLALEKAKEQQVENAQNRIVLLTDGAVNLGDANPERLLALIASIRDQGIAFDAAGISADGLNDEVLEAMTRKGDGRYYLLDSLDSADDGFAQQIAGALRPSAKNVKVQVEFNPNRVGRYKLLGFEKHRLNREDFRNDKVDAAEMAAAEAGVAVYQFEAKPDGEGDIGSVSVRFLDLSTQQMVEKRWPIPYEADAPRPDRATPSLRIAMASAMFAAKLRGEPLGELVELKNLSDLISSMPDRYRSQKRVGQLTEMIRQARQISGN